MKMYPLKPASFHIWILKFEILFISKNSVVLICGLSNFFKKFRIGKPASEIPPPPFAKGGGGISGKQSQVIGFFGCGSAALCSLWFKKIWEERWNGNYGS